jgi:hypothetical protein
MPPAIKPSQARSLLTKQENKDDAFLRERITTVPARDAKLRGRSSLIMGLWKITVKRKKKVYYSTDAPRPSEIRRYALCWKKTDAGRGGYAPYRAGSTDHQPTTKDGDGGRTYGRFFIWMMIDDPLTPAPHLPTFPSVISPKTHSSVYRSQTIKRYDASPSCE